MIKKYHLAKFRVRERDGDGALVPNGTIEEREACAERAPSQWTPATYDEAKNGIVAATTTTTTTSTGDDDVNARDENTPPPMAAAVRNTLENTIEGDDEYVKFVAALRAERDGTSPSTVVHVAPVAPETTKKKTTALLEFLWRKRAQEARRTPTPGHETTKSGGKSKKKTAANKTNSKNSKKAATNSNSSANEPDAKNAKAKTKTKAKAKAKTLLPKPKPGAAT